ncbi:maleylpyruvate isomerase family mycothiol-dependent enzyme [Propionibacteriaceae bacterium Y1923]
MTELAASREWYARLSRGVLGLIEQVPEDAAQRPGLGNWTLAELAAHSMRAWTTLTQYLADPEPTGETPISAVVYLAEGMATDGVHAGVEQRARQDAAEIGTSLAAAAREAAAAARDALDEAPDSRLVTTRFGVLALRDFLRTRNLELVVHGLDLAKALGVEPPPELVEATVPAMLLLTQVAVERGMAVPLLEAAAGRAPLDAGYNLMQ